MSVLIRIKTGDIVFRDGEKGVVEDIAITPNSTSDKSLLALLKVKMESGKTVVASANKFVPAEDAKYEEFYPSVWLFQNR